MCGSPKYVNNIDGVLCGIVLRNDVVIDQFYVAGRYPVVIDIWYSNDVVVDSWLYFRGGFLLRFL